MGDVKQLLDERIENEFLLLEDLSEEEKAKAISNIATLYKLRIEEEKVEIEADEKYNRRVMEDEHFSIDADRAEREIETRNKQYKESRFDRFIDSAIVSGTSIVTTILSIAAYNSWFKKGLTFEQTGTFTSSIVKSLITKITPKK